MAFTFSILGLSLLFLTISYFLTYTWFSKQKISQQLSKMQTELKKIKENEAQWLNENATLKNKVENSFKDNVTQLMTWKVFENLLSKALAECLRYHFSLGILSIDIDDFKMINQALGREGADKLLKEIAIRINHSIRQVDSLTRFSKDTFFVMLTQLAKPETAALVAQRILQTFNDPFVIEGQTVTVTACIGIALFPNDAQEMDLLIRNSENALHQAKSQGKQVYQFFQERMQQESQRELILYTNLNDEKIFDEFLIYYQPIKEINDKKIFCIDTILIWQHPSLKQIFSNELFLLADRKHKLNAITEWLLKSACRDFMKWRALGFMPECLAFPFYMRQLESSQFIYRISQIMQQEGFNPEWLLLTIKENTTHTSFDILEKSFNMLNYLGVKIALDDFGTHAFSLRYLKKFNINFLRLEVSSIDDIAMNQQTIILIKSIISLAKNLGLQVIIQGVETEEQLAILKGLSCHFLQGSLLGAPITAEEVEAMQMVQTH